MTNEERVFGLVEEYTRAGLIKQCEARGLSVSGTKEEMARQIVEKDQTDPDPDVSCAGAYLDAEAILEPSIGRMTIRNETPVSNAPVCAPYNFRDVEEGMEPFSADGTQDFGSWLAEFEETAVLANWSEEHKFILCRKKLIGVARSFLSTLRGVTTYSVLRKALVSEFAEIVKASDVYRRLASRKKKKEESALEFIYSMQKLAQAIEIEEDSLCEFIVDGYTADETVRTMLYEAATIAELKKKIAWRERAVKKVVDERIKKPNVEQAVSVKPRKMKCYNCGVFGHIAPNCTKAKSVMCFKCGRSGHKANECLKNPVHASLITENDEPVPSNE